MEVAPLIVAGADRVFPRGKPDVRPGIFPRPRSANRGICRQRRTAHETYYVTCTVWWRAAGLMARCWAAPAAALALRGGSCAVRGWTIRRVARTVRDGMSPA